MLERILVPLDGSQLAEAVLGQVARLLRFRDASLILFRAVPLPVQPGVDGGPFVFQDMDTEAKRYLSVVASELRTQGTKVQEVIRFGDEASGILEAARQHSATLIAMATHGRTGLAHFVFGSVTEQVLRESEIPVLVLRSFEEVAASAVRVSAREISIRRILLPVDGTENSLAVLPCVKSLARAVGASVMVLGVVDPVGRKSAGEREPLVRAAVDALSREHIAVDPLIRLGDPGTEILEASRTHDADLIAMSTHGRRGVSRLLMGSVTEKVLRSTTVPVLTFHGEHARRREPGVPRLEKWSPPVSPPATRRSRSS
jgi:nucleotide-binding universal stress UspA family protein